MSDGENAVIYALHGIQGRYCEQVIREGITRCTSGYFLINDKCDRAQFRLTLMCAVFHAIGLKMLSKAIVQQIDLCDAIRSAGGLFLLLLPFRRAISDKKLLNCYQYRGLQSCPYGKVKNLGALPPTNVYKIALPDNLMAHKIYISQPQQVLRFFQNKNGKQQFINNCDMDMLATICYKVALAVEEEVEEVIKAHREDDDYAKN